jgi:HPt (histidine-containing phosphotransfer) domain-containing protein
MNAALQYLRLPSAISPFERGYLARMNKVALGFFWAHLLVLPLIGIAAGQGLVESVALTLAVLIGPTVAYRTLDNPRSVSMVMGVASMCMGGVLVHLGQGPVQIEMHFYFFAVISLLAVFGNPMVVLAAAVTVTVHHLLLWAVLPSSVFNYEAAFWVVLVHAAFVVLSSTGAVYIGRSFFDNVVQLDALVTARTAEVEARGAEVLERSARVRHLLNNVQQAIVTVNARGELGPEWSAKTEAWLGTPTAGQTLWSLLANQSPDAAAWMELGWDSLVEDFLPRELAIAQLPQRIEIDGRTVALRYTPLGEADAPLSEVLVVMEDISATVAQEAAEAHQREFVSLVQRIFSDRQGFVEFAAEADELVAQIEAAEEVSPLLLRRLHTLKGNAAIFGLDSLSGACHALEQQIEDEGALPSAADRSRVSQRWAQVKAEIDSLLGEPDGARIEVDDSELQRVLSDLNVGVSPATVARTVASWALEPGRRRLNRLAQQSQALAVRLGKDVQVEIDGGHVRADGEAMRGVWAAAIHAVRNALDHGLEAPEARAAAGKAPRGTLRLSLRESPSEVEFIIADDGRGIAWDRVAEKATQRGLPHQSPEDLQAALFADGLSTAADVTEVSGRGVGMAALQAEVLGLGGAVQIESAAGAGTTLRLRFPRARVATVRLAA